MLPITVCRSALNTVHESDASHHHCRLYFHYIYKTSINIIFFIKVTVNYHVIDFYVNFYLIYNVTVLIFVQNCITCKITYYFNSKVSPFLKFNISLVKHDICTLCFIFWTFKFFI